MSWQLFVMGLLPLIIFVIVDSFASFRAAVIAAVAFAVAETIFTYVYFGEIDQITWASLALVIFLGFVAYKLDNSKIFKFQPVVLALIMAAIVAYFQFFDEPILLKFLPKYRMMMPEENQAVLNDPRTLEKFSKISGQLIYVFLLHAAMTAYAAARMSNVAWLMIRGVGIWVLIIGLAILNRF